MRNTESREMYLETIYTLRKKGNRVRAIDVAEQLGFSRPSVSNALKFLKKEGLLYLDEANEIVLSKQGEEQAERVYERHKVLTRFLINLGADSTMAEQNACRMEHIISDELFEIIKNKIKEEENK
ncbi:MAG: metal-dependent transcriptional regulator [Clostridia bacterium]|nr:metal-dependent transcriptional regulator [Clostridia bacterium]